MRDSGDLKKIGALWSRKTAMGEEFLSGKLDSGEQILIFRNRHKNQDKQPDWKMYVKADLTQPELQQQEQPGTRPTFNNDEEIPF